MLERRPPRRRAASLLLSLLLPGASGWAASAPRVPAPRSLSPRAPVVAAVASLYDTPVIAREAPAPLGPDPYKVVNDDLEYIKNSIRKVLSEKGSGGGALARNEVLTMAAREFMQRKGKSFRPMLVLLVGRATGADFVAEPRHTKLAVIAEMIHTASLIHADVLEEDLDRVDQEDDRMGTVVHQEVALDVGNKVCILAGDFLLAKAAVELSLLCNSDVTAIVAGGLEQICEGGMKSYDPSEGDASMSRSLDEHLDACRRRHAQLIGNACQAAAVISGHEADSTVAMGVLEFGVELAMAQLLCQEAQEAEKLIKAAKGRGAIKAAPVPSAPLYASMEKEPQLRTLLLQRDTYAAQALELVERGGGVARTWELAAESAQNAANLLQILPASAARDALVVLCHKVLNADDPNDPRS